MNKPSKLGRSCAAAAKKPEPKKKPAPRNPLKDLNAAANSSFPPPHQAPRGCFRFLLSNSSSSSKDSLPRSKSTPRTPASAPPNSKTQIAKNPSKSRKIPLKSSLETKRPAGSKDPQKSRSSEETHWRNYPKPRPGTSISGKNPKTELSFDVSLGKSGGHFASTPEKSPVAFNTGPGFKGSGVTPEKDGEGQHQLSATPTSAATPPVQASISPELGAGPTAAATPACFAAGHHVVAGVQDRRKCRPRGILTIGGPGREPGGDDADGPRASLMLPPIEEASIQWLPSPSDMNMSSRSSFSSNARTRQCTGEASVNWLLSPRESIEESSATNDKVFNQKASSFGTKFLSDSELWKLSQSPELGGLAAEKTPSSGIGIMTTPSSGGSISPFSMIIHKASPSPRLQYGRLQQEKTGYRYGLGVENSPYYGDSCGSGNVIVTPSSNSSSRKGEGLPPFDMDSVVEGLGGMSVSPKPGVDSGVASELPLPLPGLSFQFGCPATPMNSIDFGNFCEKAFQLDEFDLKRKDWLESEVRVSWREGLESRIFEMGELDCCHWISDGEYSVDDHGEDKVDPKPDVTFDSNNQIFMLKDEKDQHSLEGFGSIEFAHVADVCVQKNVAKVSPAPISCAESMSMEGGGLISSGDSDWTLFYKNHLFET